MEIKKRLAICGEGDLEDAVFDFRGNVPAIRVTRCAVLQNLFVDFSGEVVFIVHISTFKSSGVRRFSNNEAGSSPTMS